MVRIGIISFAHMHAYSYANAVKQLPNAELVGIYDDDRERGERAASTFGAQADATPEELLENVDTVIICSENSLHRKWVEVAAKYRKDILCENPLLPL